MLKPTIYIVVGIIIGIAFCKLFTSTSVSSPTNLITKPSLLKAEASKTATHFQQKVDSLNAIARNLLGKINSSKTDLALAKNKTLVLQTQLVAAKEKEVTKNSEREILICPEENLLTQFIEASTYKDSLYETIDSTRVQQLQNKDVALEVKDSMYNALKQSFDLSLSQQELLFIQNKSLHKQINRQKLKSKIVSAVILLVSASAANYLLKH